MPLITKIRDNMTTMFSVFAGVFVVYIVLDWGMDITGRRASSRQVQASEAGQVDGDHITLREYEEQVKTTTDNQRAQMGAELDDNQIRMIREQVWTQMVEDRLYQHEMKRLGISVSDNEIRQMLEGDNPPEFLKQQFTDSTGTFHQDQYLSALKNPSNRAKVIELENALRKQREREKLQSVMIASVQITEGD